MATVALQVVAGVAISAGLSFLSSKLAKPVNNEVGKLATIDLSSGSEGAPIPRVYGSSRIAGQLIWTTRFSETATTTDSGGGKGSSGSSSTTTTYTYSVSCAFAFGEGSDDAVLQRLWIDNKEVNLTAVNANSATFYTGSETQTPDSTISAVEGAANTPAFRGVCYLVLEELQLEDYGNRIPSICAEIVRPVRSTDAAQYNNAVKAINLIPATGEVVYGTQKYYKSTSTSAWSHSKSTQNVHTADGVVDAVASIDALLADFPNLEAVALTVAWFGSDLRCANCTIVPKVEDRSTLTPTNWTVGSYTKSSASIVNTNTSGSPNYGGTPSDTTVTEMITLLKSKGLRVTLYPFLLMDVSEGNTLPNPYSDNASDVGQAKLPWRGRVTCSPAPGYAGTVDKTATAATQVSTFFTAYNAFITHYANLAVSAGGVDAFLIGSEMVGLTTVRSSTGVYPAVTALSSLATSVKAIVGSGCKVGYAADWSEFVHSSTEGLWFHLDPLWANSAISFVGVDNYLPTSDWRDGRFHEDFDTAGPVSAVDADYVQGQIEGGEYYDYYYASAADRTSQTRTPITDDDYSKPWVNRRKDFANWWSNSHYNRPAWVEDASPTSWTAYSKPIWFTEFGCPAVDKAMNQPNVFYDPKSSESALPYYSSGARDDATQRFYIEQMLEYWAANSPSHSGLVMVEPENMFLWCWDARPYPAFPRNTSTWSDYANYTYGHWQNGRSSIIMLDMLVAALCEEAGLTSAQYDVTELRGTYCAVYGISVDSVGTIRSTLENLAAVYFFDAVESDGIIKFRLKSRAEPQTVQHSSAVATSSDAEGLTATRDQLSEIPSIVEVSYYNINADYDVATVSAMTYAGDVSNVEQVNANVSMDGERALASAAVIAQYARYSREEGSIVLPLSHAWLDVGDAIDIVTDDRTIHAVASKVSIGETVNADFLSFSPYTFMTRPAKGGVQTASYSTAYGASEAIFMNVPAFQSTETALWAPRVAAFASPWPGAVNVYREVADDVFTLINTHTVKNRVGVLTYGLYSGPTGVWDEGNELYVTLEYGSLQSADPLAVLSSSLAVAIENDDSEWEIVQFATATLISTGNYKLTKLLRGQLGTNYAMRNPVAAGSRVVVINNDLSVLNITSSLATTELSYRFGPSRYAYSDDTYTDTTFTGTKAALRPYSPCNAVLQRNADSTFTITWSRRTRFDGDDWSVTEVPLNEESEAYKVEIMSGATVLSTHTTTSPTLAYAWSGDFGSEPSSLSVKIYQYGQAYGGYGTPLAVTLQRSLFIP